MQARQTDTDASEDWLPDGAEVIFSSDRVRAYVQDAGAKRLVAMFDNFRPSRDGFPEPKTVLFFRSHNYASLHIQTARNDWFLSPDLSDLRAALEQATARYRHRAAMGFSMGGYGALLLARALKLRQALLVSPQISVIPGAVPWDSRFHEQGAVLDPKLDDVATSPWEGLRGVTLFDPMNKVDRRHARAIAARFPNMQPVAIPFGGHPASAPLVEAGLFRKIQSAVAGGLISPALFHEMRRAARGRSRSYATNFDIWLKQREARASGE